MTPNSNPNVIVYFNDRKSMSEFIGESKKNPFIMNMAYGESNDSLNISFRDDQSRNNFITQIEESSHIMGSDGKMRPRDVDETVTRLKVPHNVQKKKQTRKANKLDSRDMGVTRQSGLGKKTIKSQYKEFDPKKKELKDGKKGKHDCASKVEHAEWGVGSCIREQHAAPDAEGNIAWYDVMFEHGLEKQVSTDDLNVLISEMHEDHDHHHEGEELDEKVSNLKKSDAPFTVVATKGGKVLDQMNSIELGDVKDAIKFMKTDKKGAKISVESKGGKVVHTESRDRFDYLDRQAASQDRDIAAKKFMAALKKAKIKAQYGRPTGTVYVLKNDLSKAQSIGKRLNILRDGITIRASMSVKEDVNEARFDPSKNPTAKVDKEFDDARNALRKAGIPHMGQRAIGSMNRERNKFRVHPKFEKKARQALKRFPKVDLEINDKMPEKPMVRSMKEDVQLDEMSAKAHYNKMKAQGKVGRGGRVVTPIDRNRFPNREREGLEGPFRNRKTSLIYYYDKKAGKYYDPQSDMYLDVKDVMDSVQVEEGLRQAMSGPRETPEQKRKRKEKDNYDLYKKKQRRIAALRGDKSSRKLTPGQEKHYRQTVNLSQLKALSGMKKRKNESIEGVEEAVKYPHNMYDPKTGKRYVAKNREDHMRMSRMGYDHVPKAMNKSTMKEANDPHMVTELYLFITNDSNLNRQMIQPLIKNYRRKLSKGSYDEELAIKGFMNVVNAGIKAYAKEFSVGERMKVSKPDRQEVAKKLSNFYRDDIMHGY
jgi:hypothetical protein